MPDLNILPDSMKNEEMFILLAKIGTGFQFLFVMLMKLSR